MITATDEQVAVIRRGWMGTAVAVHPEVDGLTAFIESRLLELESRGELAENDLLAVVEAAAQMVLAAGNPDQARDTSRRMRRTVYEFLLALDAASANEGEAEEAGQRRSGGFGTPESQARSERSAPLEQSLLGTPSPTADLEREQIRDDADDADAYGFDWEALAEGRDAAAALPDETLAEGRAAPTALPDTGPAEAPDASAALPDEAPAEGRAAPTALPDNVPAERPDADAAPPDEAPAEGQDVPAALPDEVRAEEPERPAPEGHAAWASLEDEETPEQLPTPVAPRAGFHLTDPVELLLEEAAEAAPEPAPVSVAPLGGEPEADAGPEPDDASSETAVPAEAFELMALPQNGTDPQSAETPPHSDDAQGEPEAFTELVTPAPRERPPASQAPAAWSAKVTEANRPTLTRHEPSLVPDVWADPDLAEENHNAGAEPAPAPAPAVWRVRKPELAGEGVRHASSGDLPPDSWQPADHEEEPQPDLSAPRREIEELLRRKKYDQTGAVLQQLAQDNACRAVAELALDTGDRCRAMGKRMAATSCYLAASRADPVFEEPLTRLADVCIDDRDVDLAVSYLERVARLSRARHDIKGALRIYRKIHAIAPYRNDILDVLMRAQSTGRLDP